MPIHDWTQVTSGTFHDFHQTWIIEIKRALNSGRLPDDFSAMAEQIAGGWGPDVLTLEGPTGDQEPGGLSAVAVAERPPKVREHSKKEMDRYARKANAVAIHHATDHRVVAMIEIVSPGNKATRHEYTRFVEKAEDVMRGGAHLMVVDLLPPGRFDPRVIHSAFWAECTGETYTAPPDLPLTLASYIGGGMFEAYVEPTAVGTELIDLPLFLTADAYVPVPLEMTYQAAWDTVPAVWRKLLQEGPQ